MVYQSRIPADSDYIVSVGRAFYNFTYLEWIVVWTVVKLSANGFADVPLGKSAGHLARAFIKAIDATSPSLSQALRKNLIDFHKRYLDSIDSRTSFCMRTRIPLPAGCSNWAVEVTSGPLLLSTKQRSSLRTPQSSGTASFTVPC